VIEKGSEIGAHILSDAVLDPIGINELIPNWREKGAPIKTLVKDDRFWILTARRFQNTIRPERSTERMASGVSNTSVR
jgi:electron-transferring-flavoprotein dehydrogenase